MKTEPGHCSNALLQEYSDGVLSGEVLRDVAAHLASCASCRQSAAALRRLDEALRRLPQETADVRFTRSVMDGIGADPAYRLLIWAGAAAGITAVAGLVLAILVAAGVLYPGAAVDQEAPGSTWMGVVPEMLTRFASTGVELAERSGSLFPAPKGFEIWIFVIAVAGTLGVADYLVRRRAAQR